MDGQVGAILRGLAENVKFIIIIYIFNFLCIFLYMITIPEAVAQLVRRSPFLEDAMSRGWLNLSAVARSIRPDVEAIVQKKVKDGAVTIALNRLAGTRNARARPLKRYFRAPPDLMVRSNLFEVTFVDIPRGGGAPRLFIDRAGGRAAPFLTVTQGINETTIIAGSQLRERVLSAFEGATRIALHDGLSSVSVLLPPGSAAVPGVYSFILKALAWDGIPVTEVVSTSNEFTIVLEDRNIDTAFGLIKRLFEGR
ncbi:MAG TPA: aspartate kinase [Candidatus Aminicenantes bacterium]|nr:aspartate kinase [Candidatus Aminicenantes bacterium]